MMGYSYSQDDGPKMCFNAAKNWQLGWYASRQLLFEDKIWNGRLIGQVDHENLNADPDDKVVIKLNTASNTDYYLMFNRKAGVNAGTVEGGNQVMIVSQPGEGNSPGQSVLLSKMNAGGFYTIPNFDNSGLELTVTVNSIDISVSPGYADITIFAGCTVNSDCDDGNSCNGDETCSVSTGQCTPGTPDVGCCGNGVCESAVGETFLTCPVDGCFYDCGADCQDLQTTFAGGNGSNGNIFKVQALQDVVVTSFTIHSTNAGSGTVKIWDKEGDYVGFESNSGAWNEIMNEGFTSNGSGQQSPLAKLNTPVFIAAGTFHSFYVYSSVGIRYTTGSTEGIIFAQNSDLIFYEGKGSGGEIGAGTFSPRVWNGIIEYGLGDSSPAPTPNPTPFPTNLPTPLPTPAPTKEPITPPPTPAPTTAPVSNSR